MIIDVEMKVSSGYHGPHLDITFGPGPLDFLVTDSLYIDKEWRIGLEGLQNLWEEHGQVAK